MATVASTSTSTFSLNDLSSDRNSQSILINSQQTQRQSCWKGKDREQEESRDRVGQQINLNGHSNHKDGIKDSHTSLNRSRTTRSNPHLEPVEAIGFLLLLLLHLFYHFYLSLLSSFHFLKRFFSPHRQSQSQSQDEIPRIPSGLRIPSHLALVRSPPSTRTRFLFLRSLFLPNGRDSYQKLELERQPDSESPSSRRESDLLALLIQDAKNVVEWSAMVGTREVSIYDARGLLKKQVRRDPYLFDGISIRRTLLEDEDEDSEGEQDSFEMQQHSFSVKVQPFIQGNPIHLDHQDQSSTIPSVQELQERALRKRRAMGLSSSSTSNLPPTTTAALTSSQLPYRTSDLCTNQDRQSTLATSPLRDYPSQSQQQIINDSHQPSRTIHIKLNLLSSIDGQPAIARAAEEITKRACERAEGLKREGNRDRPKEDLISLEKSGSHVTNGDSRESIKERRDSVIKDLTVLEVEKVLRGE